MAAPRVDRRLAAIMALDVVGYSRLMGADEAGTLARVKAHRKQLTEPLIAEHRGRVVKLTGDGALVEFGSAVDAVECAVALQTGMVELEAAEPEERRIRYRIGINIGDIVLEDGDIFGDGVNVATRLEGLAEPGGICVARNVHDQVKAKLDLSFEPMGEHWVKNIAEPITLYRVRADPGTVVPSRPGLWPPAAVSGADATEEGPALPLPHKPSIAVLPFENLSGEERYERLADGITEDIITDLSRFRDFYVIARNSTIAYKHKPKDVRQIGRELGVHYVLEGSLQTDGKRVRLSAQFVDAATGSHVWSERYDRPLDQFFAVQDEVARTIAASLAGEHGVVARAGRETARRKPPEDLQAYEYYLLGLEQQHLLTEEGNKKAQELFQKALALDPNFARAYVSLAWTYNDAQDNGWGASRQELRAKWLGASKKAVALDPLDGEAHMILGWYYQYTSDFERARAEIEQALDLNPNSADVLAGAGGALSWLGKPEQAVEVAERSMRLNPRFPDWYYGPVRDAYFHAGYFDKAILASKKRQNIRFWDLVYRPLCYAQLERHKEVADAVAELWRRDPDYSAEKFLSDNGTYAREVELNLFLDSHRKAGLPVCATEAQLAKYPDMRRLAQCEAQRASG